MFKKCFACILALGLVCGMAFAAEELPYEKETIGGLHIGLSEKEVNKLVPCKPKPGRDRFWHADGEYHQAWKYPDCGIELDMISDKKGRAKTVGSITVTSPSTMRTSKGIGIGSTEQEVARAYGRFKNKEDSRGSEFFVAGSIYGGLMFDFKQGKVKRIFIGAGAE